MLASQPRGLYILHLSPPPQPLACVTWGSVVASCCSPHLLFQWGLWQHLQWLLLALIRYSHILVCYPRLPPCFLQGCLFSHLRLPSRSSPSGTVPHFPICSGLRPIHLLRHSFEAQAFPRSSSMRLSPFLWAPDACSSSDHLMGDRRTSYCIGVLRAHALVFETWVCHLLSV